MESIDREKLIAVMLFVATSLILPVLATVTREEPGKTAAGPHLVRSALLELKLDAMLQQYGPAVEDKAETGEETGMVFSTEYWLAFSATMEKQERVDLLRQLAVACELFGRAEDARHIQLKGRLEIAADQPFAYVLEKERVRNSRIERDQEQSPLPATMLRMVEQHHSLDAPETASPEETLRRELEPFAAGAATVVALFALFFIAGLVLLGLAPRLARRFPVPSWAFGVNRFRTLPLQTYGLFLTWFAVSTLLGMAGVMLLHGELSNSAIVFTVYVASALAGFWLVRTKAMTDAQSPLVTVDMDRLHLRTILFGVGGYVAAVPVVAILAWLSAVLLGGGAEGAVNPAVPLLMDADGDVDRWLVIFSVVVMAPLFEEFLFRGFLFQQFRRWLGVAHGIALCGLVFAAVHQSVELFLPLFGLGVILALVYHYSQSLWASIITHGLWNLATVVAIVFLYGD